MSVGGGPAVIPLLFTFFFPLEHLLRFDILFFQTVFFYTFFFMSIALARRSPCSRISFFLFPSSRNVAAAGITGSREGVVAVTPPAAH